MFHILIFFRDLKSLEDYLNRFIIFHSPSMKCRHKFTNGIEYECDGVYIRCIRGIHENARGHKASFIAVQEELTWTERWELLRDCILSPMLLSPIPIHIFDGADSRKTATCENEQETGG